MKLLSIILIFMFATICCAQTLPPLPSPPEHDYEQQEVQEIMPRRGDITQNVHIVFDKSGSMRADDIAQALVYVRRIIEQSFDGFNVAITVFGNNSMRLSVAEDSPVAARENWLAMPSEDAVSVIEGFIYGAMIDNSNTDVAAPVLAALNEEGVEGVSIIVVSDCIFSDFAYLRDALADKDVKVGFVDINGHLSQFIYQGCIENGWWLMDGSPPDESEEPEVR